MNSQTILLYILKSVFISGIFFGYYWIALRNKNFNYYNRFYLLLSIAGSIVIPFFNFNWFAIEKQKLPVSTETLNFISTQIVDTGATTVSWQEIVCYVAGGISLFLLIMFAFNIMKVYQLKKRSAIIKMDKVDFIYTNLDHAPFSFLNNLFWKESISLDEEYGQKIFKHEITHIEQKHTLDVLFCQIINAVFWMNPFNWLIQKELKVIHEFIADKEALGNNDVEEFVKLLLQAHYGKHFLNPTHSFYYSSIKRRLFMLTRTNKARFSQVRKLLVVPVSLLVVVTMSVSTIESKATTIIAPTIPAAPVVFAKQKPVTPSLAQQPVKQAHRNDTTPAPAKAKDQPLKLKLDSNIKSEYPIAVVADRIYIAVGSKGDSTKNGAPVNILYYVNDVEASAEDVKNLKPDQIKSIRVWKDKEAVKKFGEAGANGVIEIFTKVTP